MNIFRKLTMVLLLAATAAWAATPPALINYQGVLRNAAGVPSTGTFDMVFRFYDIGERNSHGGGGEHSEWDVRQPGRGLSGDPGEKRDTGAPDPDRRLLLRLEQRHTGWR